MNDPEFTRSEKEIQAEILEQPPADDRRRPKTGLKLVLVATLLVLGSVAVALGFGYRYWQELQSTLGRLDRAISVVQAQQTEYRQQIGGMHQTLESQQQRLAEEKARLVSRESQREQGQERLAEERLQLQQQWVEMREMLKAAQRPAVAAADGSDWLPAEVEYLIQVANDRLFLVGDVGTAIQALETADRRLGEAGGPEWSGVREQLAADISRLQAVAQPDPAALSARLTELEQAVTSLGLMASEGITEKPGSEENNVTPMAERSLETLLRDGWDGLRSVLVIRHHDQPPSIGLPPQQQYFVYQNLRLQLAAARLALLRGDQRQYQTSLQQLERWLLEFFDPKSPATLAVLVELRDLSQINLSPVLPDISGSLIALREQLRSSGEKGVIE